MMIPVFLALLFALVLFAVTKASSAPRELMLVWNLFAVTLFSFSLRASVPELPEMVRLALALAGAASCGMTFLLARTLFQPKEGVSGWPVLLVGALLLSGAIAILARAVSPEGAHEVMWVGLIDRLHGLLSSTVLLLALIEPLRGLKAASVREFRFRLGFAVIYAILLALAVLWARQLAELGDQENSVRHLKLTCALMALFGGGIAVWFRLRHPLDVPKLERSRTPLTEDDQVLAGRIRAVLQSPEFYTNPDARLADLALRLNAPPHHVTRAITGVLGFANFNRLINEERLKAVVSKFDDSRFDHLPVLSIALECGFGSIGPFNRAFRDRYEMTPSAYRRNRNH